MSFKKHVGFGIKVGIYDQKLPYSQTASFILQDNLFMVRTKEYQEEK